jgi:hypothetical protein
MLETDQETRQRIIAEIENAFADVRRGNSITLHQARVLDDYGDEIVQAAARRKDTEIRWQDIPDAWIEKLADTLPFLDPEGFCYYIPAFMIWALRHYETSDSFAGAAAVYAFGVNPSGEGQMARLRLFTPRQAAAIAHFLEYFAHRANGDHADNETAQEALDAYWQQFL